MREKAALTNKKQTSMLPDYNSPSQLKELLGTLGFSMQKKFGQNFLINGQIRSQLISMLNLEAEKNDGKGDFPAKTPAGEPRSGQTVKPCTVWEIGAGLGAMTQMLLNSGVFLTAFEIDKGFASLLESFFGARRNFKLIQGDVQKTWRKEITESGMPDIIFGNIPYNISLEFIAAIVESPFVFKTMLFTVQKEAALRVTAERGNKNYTALSVLCARAYGCKIVKIIPPSAFWPRPHVESAALLFTPKNDLTEYKSSAIFTKLVKALFSSRRKTIKNNLNEWLKTRGLGRCTETVLQEAKLDGNLRAETLSLYDFLLLSDIVSDVIGNAL